MKGTATEKEDQLVEEKREVCKRRREEVVNERHGLPLVASPEAKISEETHDGDTVGLAMSLRGG